MQTYVALLRGINVSGQKKIKMADLRALLESEGFQEVRTYIQSGNILFAQAKESSDKIAARIAAIIKQHYGFEVVTLVKQAADFGQAIEENPFAKDPKKDPKRFYVTFLHELPDPELVEQLKAYKFQPEEYVLISKNVYFYSPDSYGRAKMNNNFFEKKLKVAATTRNWRSVNILFEMSQASA